MGQLHGSTVYTIESAILTPHSLSFHYNRSIVPLSCNFSSLSSPDYVYYSSKQVSWDIINENILLYIKAHHNDNCEIRCENYEWNSDGYYSGGIFLLLAVRIFNLVRITVDNDRVPLYRGLPSWPWLVSSPCIHGFCRDAFRWVGKRPPFSCQRPLYDLLSNPWKIRKILPGQR